MYVYIYMASFLAYVLTFHLAFYRAFCLAFYLCLGPGPAPGLAMVVTRDPHLAGGEKDILRNITENIIQGWGHTELLDIRKKSLVLIPSVTVTLLAI